MKIVKEMPPVSSRRTRSSQYDRFFDGRICEIAPADVPHTDLATLRATLIRRARRQNWTITTAMRHDPERLFVQLKSVVRSVESLEQQEAAS